MGVTRAAVSVVVLVIGCGPGELTGAQVVRNTEAMRADLQKQCDAGDGSACYYLAQDCEQGHKVATGETVAIDEERAAFFYYKACDLRHDRSCERARSFKPPAGRDTGPKVDLPKEAEVAELRREVGKTLTVLRTLAPHTSGDFYERRKSVIPELEAVEKDLDRLVVEIKRRGGGRPRPDDVASKEWPGRWARARAVLERGTALANEQQQVEETAAAAVDATAKADAAARAACENDRGNHAGCIQACDRGDGFQCFYVGVNYAEGIEGALKKDPVTAIGFFRKACGLRVAKACKHLEKLGQWSGTCSKEEDCAKLCAGGFAEGCWSQGDIHFEGRGVPKNFARGLELFKKACDGGSTNGCTALALAYQKGRGVARDLSAARTYFKKACDGGYGPACTGMTNVDCVVAAKTPRQRRVGDDAKCAAAKGHRANSRIVDSSKTYVAYETPDSNKLDICFSAMVSEGCYQINIQARDTSIYCCP